MRVHERDGATGDDVNRSGNQRDQKVKEQSQEGNLHSAITRARAQRAGGYAAKDDSGRDAAANVTKNTGVSDVECTGNQPADEDRLEQSRGSLFHLSLDSRSRNCVRSWLEASALASRLIICSASAFFPAVKSTLHNPSSTATSFGFFASAARYHFSAASMCPASMFTMP